MDFLRKLFGGNASSKHENHSNAFKQNSKVESEDIYKESVMVFMDNYLDPDMIYDKIYRLTRSENEALLIYLFIPYYFCRLVVPEVNYTNYYIIENADKSKSSIKFSQSKVLSELFKSIEDNWDSYSKMNLEKILFHSGDFQAINDALNKGSKIEDLQALPPTIPYQG